MNPSDKILMINLSMQKAKQALSAAEENLKSGQLETALNRNYYAIFYSVMSLGYKYDFATSKHSKLVGWFNKKFIHEEKLFGSEMYEIYSKAFERRQKCDYDITYKATAKTVEKLIEKSKHFIVTVENQI